MRRRGWRSGAWATVLLASGCSVFAGEVPTFPAAGGVEDGGAPGDAAGGRGEDAEGGRDVGASDAAHGGDSGAAEDASAADAPIGTDVTDIMIDAAEDVGEEVVEARCFVDGDGDGYGAGPAVACGVGAAERSGDCDDDDSAVSPGARERCETPRSESCDRVGACSFIGVWGEDAAALIYSGGHDHTVGGSLAAADINGDGYAELLVGAPGVGGADDGQAYLVSPGVNGGGELRLDHDHAARFYANQDDGHLGYAVGLGEVWGAPRAVIAAPDADGSGEGGLVAGVSTPLSPSKRELEIGKSGFWCAVGAHESDRLGWSLALGAGVAGADLLAGHPGFDHDAGSWGEAVIFSSAQQDAAEQSCASPVAAAARLQGPSSGSRFGWSVSVASGGSPLVGAPGVGGSGAAYRYAPGGTGVIAAEDAAARWTTGEASAQLGYAVLGVPGLLGAERVAGVVLGAPGAAGGAGRVYLGEASEGGVRDVAGAPFALEGAAGEGLGAALAWGDFNGDGASDLVVAGGVPTSGGEIARVWLYYGPFAPGRRSTAEADAAFLIPTSNREHRRVALASADFNGDGLDDLAIGLPHVGGANGSVRVYLAPGAAE